MQIPITSPKDAGAEKHCFITANDGYYLKKTNKLYQSVTPIERIGAFEEITPAVKWMANKLPWSLIEKANEFFKAIYVLEEAEGIVLLTYNNDTWDIVVPQQVVSAGHVDYDSSDCKGIVGSIHSHCMMSAFFSATDDKDQATSDGLHIVLGKIMCDIPEIVASIYVNGYEHKCDLCNVIDDVPTPKQVVHDWMSVVDVVQFKEEEGFVL